MIETFLTFLEVYVLPWGVVGVFVASVVEEVIAPIPSALIMTTSGFLFVSGPVAFDSIIALVLKVALPAALGVTIGSFFVYFVVRYGGKFAIEKWGKYIGLYWSDIEKLQAKLSGTRKDEIIISLARVVPIVPSVAISALCGIIEMPILKYSIITFLGMFVRGLILGVVGWQLGNVYQEYALVIDQVGDYVLMAGVLVVAVYIGYKIVQKYK